MKIKSLLLLILTVALGVRCSAQVTIEDCYREATRNYPQIKQYGLIEKMKDFNLSNASKAYLPQVMLSAQASWQSEVTELPIDMPNIDKLSKDHYGVSLDVNQVIWDGGSTSKAKDRVKTEAAVQSKNVDVELYSLRRRVNQLYFGLLLADEQIEQCRLYQADLQRNYDDVMAYINSGVANQSDLDAVEIEMLKAKQKELDFDAIKKAYTEMLSLLTGQTFDADTRFVKPDATLPTLFAINRPELEFYDARIQNHKAAREQIDTDVMPHFSAFVKGAYSRPGLNMLDNAFSPYFMGGIKMSWNITGFYQRKNRKNIIDSQIMQVETQRESFLMNVNLDVANIKNVIDKYTEQLKYDDKIIALRKSIRESSQAKLANGVISGTELMREMNAEQLAQQDKILHRMMCLSSIYDLKYATNN